MKIHLRETGGRRGFYRELWALIQPSEKLFLGHEESGRYSRGSFLILPESEICEGYLIACNSEKRREEVKKLIQSDTEFKAVLARMIHKKFCHFTIGKEIHMGGPFLLKRVWVLRFLTVQVNQSTEIELLPWKRDLELIARKLGLTPAS